MKTANNKRFEYSLLESWLFLYHLAEENEIEHLQLCLLFFDNTQSENKSEKALEPSKPGESLSFLYL